MPPPGITDYHTLHYILGLLLQRRSLFSLYLPALNSELYVKGKGKVVPVL